MSRCSASGKVQVSVFNFSFRMHTDMDTKEINFQCVGSIQHSIKMQHYVEFVDYEAPCRFRVKL